MKNFVFEKKVLDKGDALSTLKQMIPILCEGNLKEGVFVGNNWFGDWFGSFREQDRRKLRKSCRTAAMIEDYCGCLMRNQEYKPKRHLQKSYIQKHTSNASCYASH